MVLCDLKDCLYNLLVLHRRLKNCLKVDVVDLMDNCDEKIIAEKYNQKILDKNEIESEINNEVEKFKSLVNEYYCVDGGKFGGLRVVYDEDFHILRVKKPLNFFKNIDNLEGKTEILENLIFKLKHHNGFPVTGLVYKPNILDITL